METRQGRVVICLILLLLTFSGSSSHGIGVGETFSDYANFTCKSWTCQNTNSKILSENYLRQMGCFCDDFCELFGDCCEDLTPTTKKDSVDVSLLDYIECRYDCLVSTKTHFYMVSSCPKDHFDQGVSDLCSTSNKSDPFLSIPGTGKRTGLLYKNIYCAQCHNEEVNLWQINVECKADKPFDKNVTYSLTELIRLKNCQTQFRNPQIVSHVRPCCGDMISSCPNNADLANSTACEVDGQKLVYSSNRVYKNPSCAECNEASSLRCFSFKPGTPCQMTISVFDLNSYSLSMLFDMNTGRKLSSDSIKSELEAGSSCSSTEVYDPFKDVCRTVTCSKGYNYTNGKCDKFGTNGTELTGTDNETRLHCPHVVLNESEFTMLEDGSLEDTFSKVVHERGQFILEGNTALVCVQTFRFLISVSNFSSLQGIISGVGMIISLIALLLTILVYIIFNALRNTPGCNILCLSISLFLAELIMLVAPSTEEYQTVCKVFGVLIHYLFLVAFMWMNVIAVDIWSTFSRGKLRSHDTLTKRFARYSVYAWIVPTVPVVTATIMDITLPWSPYSPGYGRGVCWITNPLSLAVFFAGPLALLVLINTILFTITSASICIVTKSSAQRLGRVEKREFLIYIKLFVVMGLTWMLGFLSAFVPHPVTAYLYIVVNSLQGLFIAFSFICTRQVLDLVRKKVTVTQSESVITSTQHLSSFSSHI